MDCSPSGSSIHGILQTRVLEWVAISFSRGSSRPRDRTQSVCIVGRRFTIWATREVPLEDISKRLTSAFKNYAHLNFRFLISLLPLSLHPSALMSLQNQWLITLQRRGEGQCQVLWMCGVGRGDLDLSPSVLSNFWHLNKKEDLFLWTLPIHKPSPPYPSSSYFT